MSGCVVGEGDGEPFVAPVERVGDGPLGDPDVAADQAGADIEDGAVLAVAKRPTRAITSSPNRGAGGRVGPRPRAGMGGDRSEFTARCLRGTLPAEDRADAVFGTDFLAAYRAVVPDERHAAAGVERFWRTVRQRCAGVVRKTLSFSKRLENHVGVLWLVLHLFNASRT